MDDPIPPASVHVTPETFTPEMFPATSDDSDSSSEEECDMMSSSEKGDDFDSVADTGLILEATLFRLFLAYRFLRRIHTNDSSAVYLAVDTRSGQMVAVKTQVHDYNTGDPVEVQVLSKLLGVDHCQQLLAYYRFPHSVALVSPVYAEHAVLTDTGVCRHKVRLFMRQLMTVLQALHDRGIIHRDVKLSNLLWDDVQHTLTLIDYDLSTFKRPAGHTRYAGTDGFEAPEMLVIDMLHGTTLTYDDKIDIYSAGVVFGQLLFNCAESDVTRRKVTRWKKISKRESSTAHCLMREMLSDCVSERPTTQQILAHEYFR